MLPNLIRLNLSENALNGELSEIAGQLVQLEELHLDCNSINLLPPSIAGWKNMIIFTISDNLLTTLPYEISELIELKTINVKNNQLVSIPAGLFQNCNKLERLHFSGNLLRRIPDEIGLCINLIMIDFSTNIIEEIPVTLSTCCNLELMHFGTNKIQSIAPEIFSGLIKLKELQLFKNKISIIPSEIGKLHDLERVSLASNNIKTLPEEIGDCEALRELYLSNNAKLISLPNSAGHLRRLQELVMRKCPALKQLPSTGE